MRERLSALICGRLRANGSELGAMIGTNIGLGAAVATFLAILARAMMLGSIGPGCW